MKIQNIVLAIPYLSTFVSCSPVLFSNNENEGTTFKCQDMRYNFAKRHLSREYFIEIKEQVSSVSRTLAGYFSDTNIDFALFQSERGGLERRLHWIHETCNDDTVREKSICKVQTGYLDEMFDAFEYAIRLRSRYSRHNYPGSRDIEELSRLHLRILSLVRFTNKGAAVDENVGPRLLGYATQFRKLESRSMDGNGSEIKGTKDYLYMRIRRAIEMVNYLGGVNDYSRRFCQVM